MNRRIHFHFSHQYQPFYDRSVEWSWVDFTFLHLGVEYSPYKGSCEVEFSILGLYFALVYVYRPYVPEEESV